MAVTDPHSEMYYTVRAFVRFVFWGSLFSIVAFTAYNLGSGESGDECDVTVHRDFTWTPNNGSLPSLDWCDHPSMIRLEADGTWRWED